MPINPATAAKHQKQRADWIASSIYKNASDLHLSTQPLYYVEWIASGNRSDAMTMEGCLAYVKGAHRFYRLIPAN
jgi:hypothetical protein